MKTSVNKGFCVAMLCAMSCHLCACAIDTGKLYFFATVDTKWGFGSDEAETAPTKDGRLKFDSALFEEVVRDKMIDQQPDAQPTAADSDS